MFATSERRNEISRMVADQKHVDVSELSSLFRVSEVTIRKDLIFLEKNGILIRTHGGAVPIDQITADTNASEQKAIKNPAIAKVTSCLVGDGDLIYLGTGAVCTDIARLLVEKESLCVLTNNITAASILVENKDISVMTPPGELQKKLDTCLLTGEDTISYFSDKAVDKAIISVDAIKMDSGFSIQDPMVCKIYSEVMMRADEKIVIAESECFNRNAISFLAPATDADKIVGDENMPEKYISYFYNHGIKVYNSYDIDIND